MRIRAFFAAMAVSLGMAGSGHGVDVFYDFSVSDGGWSNTSQSYQQFTWSPTGIGGANVWTINGADNQVGQMISPELIATATSVTITMQHRYIFEYELDGARLIAVIGNTYPLVNFNGAGAYNTMISNQEPNSWNTKGWTGVSPNFNTSYLTSVATISGLTVGQSLWFVPETIWDGSIIEGPPAWQIASINISNVTVVPEPSTYVLGALATGVMAAIARRRKARRA